MCARLNHWFSSCDNKWHCTKSNISCVLVSSGNNYYCAAFIFIVFPAASMDHVHWQLLQAIKDVWVGKEKALNKTCLLSGSCWCTLKQKSVASDAALSLFSSESYHQNTSRSRVFLRNCSSTLFLFEKGPGSTPASLEPRIIRERKGSFFSLDFWILLSYAQPY